MKLYNARQTKAYAIASNSSSPDMEDATGPAAATAMGAGLAGAGVAGVDTVGVGVTRAGVAVAGGTAATVAAMAVGAAQTANGCNADVRTGGGSEGRRDVSDISGKSLLYTGEDRGPNLLARAIGSEKSNSPSTLSSSLSESEGTTGALGSTSRSKYESPLNICCCGACVGADHAAAAGVAATPPLLVAVCENICQGPPNPAVADCAKTRMFIGAVVDGVVCRDECDMAETAVARGVLAASNSAKWSFFCVAVSSSA
jgi:hypothetical protein